MYHDRYDQVNNMKKWRLDEADVCQMGGGGYMKSHGKPANTQRAVEVTLLHRPTRISVTLRSPLVSMSRPAAAKLRDDMRAQLLPQLEELVAKHLRVPGR